MGIWSENRNGSCSHTLIPKVLNVKIGWESNKGGKSGYRVSIDSRSLKNLFGDIPSAKAASLGFAKKILLELQNVITDMECEIKGDKSDESL